MAVAILFFFFFQREHFLIALLLLELITIILVVGVPMLNVRFGITSTPLILLLLTLRACEARLGLAVMVYIVRFNGNDLLQRIRVGRV